MEGPLNSNVVVMPVIPRRIDVKIKILCVVSRMSGGGEEPADKV